MLMALASLDAYVQKYAKSAAKTYCLQGFLAPQFVMYGKYLNARVVNDQTRRDSELSTQVIARQSYAQDDSVHTVILLGHCLVKIARKREELIDGLTAHDYPDALSLLRVDVMQADGTRRSQVAQVEKTTIPRTVSPWLDCPLEIVGTDLLSLFWQTYNLMKCP